MNAETKPTLSLHRKLAQVMHEVGRIPKNGTAPQIMGGYKFVQVGDAADAIRSALAEKLITMMPTNVQVVGQVDRPTAKGGTMTTVDLVVTWTLTDGESGETIEIQSFGAGADGGDKYSGKASTSAMKYALLSGFLLSTGEDSELGTAQAVQPNAGGFVDGPPRRGTPAARDAAKGEVLDAYMQSDDLRGDQVKPVLDALSPTPDGGLIGTAITQGTQDAELRQSPTGWTLPFRVKNGQKSFIVVAEDALAEAIALVKEQVIGQRVEVWGRWSDETIPAKGTKPEIRYRILHLERIQTPDFILPADEKLPEPPDDVSLPFEGEALPEPLFGEKVPA